MKLYTRVVTILAALFFGVPGLALLVVAFTGKPALRGVRLGAGIGMLVFAFIPFLIFRYQRSALTKATARIQATIDAIAARLFDAPVQARSDFDGTVLIGGFETMIRAFDGASWPVAEGQCRGAHVLVTSHASVVGRQMFEMFHVYSYVVVEVPDFARQFALTENAKTIALFGGVGRSAKVGDEAFERAWTIDADEADARAALTPLARERLLALRSKVTQVSQDFMQGRMSVRMTPRGLALRWPGSLDVELATYVRDLMLEMREGLATRRA